MDEDLILSQRIDYLTTSPMGMKALGSVYSYVQKSGLDAGLIELVYFRISQINGCAYCLDLHSKDLLRRGVAQSKVTLVQVWRETGALFTAQERAALSWAECVTNVAQDGVPDDEFVKARETFSEEEIVDLTIAVGLMNAFNRLAIAFRRLSDTVSATR
jgi:AhpD family alkylhydroperoxidase